MTQGIGQYVTVLQIKAHLSALTTSDDAILEDICEGVNQWMEGRLGRSFAKDTAASYLFDGYTAYTSRNDFGLWLKAPNVLPIPNGIQAISLLEVAVYTGGAFSTVTAGTYFLRPAAQDRQPPGSPATELWLSNMTGQLWYPPGMENIRVTGTFGWATIPADLTSLATDVAINGYRGRSSSGGDVGQFGMDNDRTFDRFLSREDRRTLDRYAVPKPLVG